MALSPAELTQNQIEADVYRNSDTREGSLHSGKAETEDISVSSRNSSSLITRRRDIRRQAPADLILPVESQKRVVKHSESDYDDNHSVQTAGSPTSTSAASSGFYSASRRRTGAEKVDRKWLDIMSESQNRQNLTAQKLLNKKFNLQNSPNRHQHSPYVRKIHSERRHRNPSESPKDRNTPAGDTSKQGLSRADNESLLGRSYSETDISRIPFSPTSDTEQDNRPRVDSATNSECSRRSSDVMKEPDDASTTGKQSLQSSVQLSNTSVDINISRRSTDTAENENENTINAGSTQIRLSGTGVGKLDESSRGQIVINIVTPPGSFGDSNVQFREKHMATGTSKGALTSDSSSQNAANGGTRIGAAEASPPPTPPTTTSEDVPLIPPKNNRKMRRCCFCCWFRCGLSDAE